MQSRPCALLRRGWLAPDPGPGRAPERAGIARGRQLAWRDRAPAAAVPGHGETEEVIRFAAHAQIAEHEFVADHARLLKAVVEPGKAAHGRHVSGFGQRLRVRAIATEPH